MELSPRKIGLLDHVEINQRKKQNGAVLTILNHKRNLKMNE